MATGILRVKTVAAAESKQSVPRRSVLVLGACERSPIPRGEPGGLLRVLQRDGQVGREAGIPAPGRIELQTEDLGVGIENKRADKIDSFGKRGFKIELDLTASAIYLSPEQVSQGVAAPGADIYAFGAVIFELCTGEAAFDTTSSLPELVQRKRADAPPKITAFRPDLPEAIDEVVVGNIAGPPDAIDKAEEMFLG